MHDNGEKYYMLYVSYAATTANKLCMIICDACFDF